MTGMWIPLVLVFLVAMFALGIGTAAAFRKPHAPDRRSGVDRRTGADRRALTGPREIWTDEQRIAFRREHGLPDPDPHDTGAWTDERRAAYRAAHGLPTPADEQPLAQHGQHDRRSGIDRRRRRPWWPRATVVTAAAFLSLVGVVAYGESQVPSIFSETEPELTGAGWAGCGTPITWSMDTSRLTPAQARTAVSQMTGDFTKWGAASGLTFRFFGEVPTTYDDTAYAVTSDIHPSDRHIFVTFLRDSDSGLLDDRTVGFATPTKVYQDRKEIVEGSVALSIDYVQKANRLHRSSLYLHELGHALGLGHGSLDDDAMYYLVDTTNDLSPADVAGIKALTQVCPSASPTP